MAINPGITALFELTERRAEIKTGNEIIFSTLTVVIASGFFLPDHLFAAIIWYAAGTGYAVFIARAAVILRRTVRDARPLPNESDEDWATRLKAMS